MLLEITPWLWNPEVRVIQKAMETESLSETLRAWRASGGNTINIKLINLMNVDLISLIFS